MLVHNMNIQWQLLESYPTFVVSCLVHWWGSAWVHWRGPTWYIGTIRSERHPLTVCRIGVHPTKGCQLGSYDTFTIEIKPSSGSVVIFQKTIPQVPSAVMTLN